MKKIIPYGRHNITEDDISSVVEVLKSSNLTQGPKIQEFENMFAEYVGSKYAIAVSNGTAALHIAALALGVKKGSKIITTPITFSASANCIRYCEGEVVFCDIDSKTYLMDYEKLENILSSSPKGTYEGIILVNFAGRLHDLELFNKLATRYGAWIIEDACHSPGGWFIDSVGTKQNSGNAIYSKISIFSFHPVKHITSGEGGMVTTNDKEIYEHLKNLRTHGIQQNPEKKIYNDGPWYYEMQELGFNYRLTDIQAALGISQLKRANFGIQRRIDIAKKYNNFFNDKDYIIGHSKFIDGHAYHLYIIEVDRRNELFDFLVKKNIIPQIHYIPVHLMPYYRDLGWKNGDLPVSESYYSKCISLPIFPTLTSEEQDFVLSTISDFYN